MFINSYKYEDYKKKSFECPEGIQLVKIVGTEVTTSKTGKQMLVVKLAVNNSNGIPYQLYYPEGDFFNRNLSKLFDAFEIQVGNFNFKTWNGKVAKADFKKKEVKIIMDDGTEKFIKKIELENLIIPKKETMTTDEYETEIKIEEDLIF